MYLFKKNYWEKKALSQNLFHGHRLLKKNQTKKEKRKEMDRQTDLQEIPVPSILPFLLVLFWCLFTQATSELIKAFVPHKTFPEDLHF